MNSFTSQEICRHVGGELTGPADLRICGIEILSRAGEDQVSFVRDSRHAAAYRQSRAGVVLVSSHVSLEPNAGAGVIRVPDADAALVKVLDLFAPTRPRPETGIHPSAHIDRSAVLGSGVAVGPNCIIGAGARVGDGCVLHANVFIYDGGVLGTNCEIFPGVVIRERTELGDRVVVHANAVIGSDGFGYQPAPDGRGVVRVPHIGTVQVGNDVEIGAGTCVDRGKFSATTIGDGTKIDNLCQIAHNCRIGRMCLIAGQVGIAGSVTVGDGVIIGGKVAIKDQITIGSGVRLAACAAVMCDVPAGVTWAGYPARDVSTAKREHAAMRRLPDLVKASRADRARCRDEAAAGDD